MCVELLVRLTMSTLTIELLARRNNRPTKFELKGKPIEPCPFCGCKDIHLAQDDWMHWCGCSDCGVEGPVRDSRLHAIGIWNRRKT